MKAKWLWNTVTIGAFVLYCAAASSETPAPQKQGLHLSVQEASVEAGSPVDLHWEIVPDGLGSVAIVLGLIQPDGSVQYYAGPREGFSASGTIESAKRLASDFPFSTGMSAVLSVTIPAEWPKGTYQFVAAVMDGKTALEIDYSNSFTVQ
ncbi:MAG: hypothetical protein P8123_00995 [bacterium]